MDMKNIWIFGLFAAACLWPSCTDRKDGPVSGLHKNDFEAQAEGGPVALYVLTNSGGAEACITNYGGRVVSLTVPDRDGRPTDVVLGYDNIADYMASPGNFGALIGRYGNRIAQGQFTLDGAVYQLPRNNNGHCLHGGPQGYHTKVWNATQPDAHSLELTYLSADGEAGFPGNLHVKVTYTLTDDNALDILYEATTDRATVVNLTNHSYFNLSGIPGSNILDHLIQINADHYTPVDDLLIPTSETASVEGTPLDLRHPQPVGKQIDDPFDQLAKGRGYDHNWVLNTRGDVTQRAALVASPSSGIIMEVFTNEPAIQLYTGNAMSGFDIGKFGTRYPLRGALCLETQHYPDSPNHPDFPSTTLLPGQKYISRCIYRFTTDTHFDMP
jgi:aldose 1-epimerase